ncbi:MAG TPA: DJ-1/PfpI family protein [Proteiniclasticum sp.]|nr:DJ-1/PfpI family protein [Proteiniclasticum sp.]
MSRKVGFIILDHFADWEGAYLSSILLDEELGLSNKVFWASTDLEPKKSLGNMTVIPDMILDDIPEDTDALILIGGNSWRSEAAEKVTPVVRRFIASGKIIGFICDATYYAAKEGFLNDVKHTGNDLMELKELDKYKNEKMFLMENAVRDDKIITANGNSPVEFTGEVLKALEIMSDEEIRMQTDFYLMGYWNALKKYGFLE